MFKKGHANEAARRDIQNRIAQQNDIGPEDVVDAAIGTAPMPDTTEDQYQFGYIKFRDGTEGWWGYIGGMGAGPMVAKLPSGEILLDTQIEETPYYEFINESYEYTNRSMTPEEVEKAKSVLEIGD